MPLVKVSRRYQVVIPNSVREALQLQLGQELHIYVVDGRIHSSKPGSIKDLRGIAKGTRWKRADRDHTERF